MFLSPYKNSRVVSREFLKPNVLKFRAIGEYFFGRSWAHGWQIYSPDARFVIGFSCIWYFCQRYFHSTIENDEYDRVVIKRWGGSVDSVRTQLTPADQARARAYIQFEQNHAFFVPMWLLNKPEGLDLPTPAAH